MDPTAGALGGDTGRCYIEKENKERCCTENTITLYEVTDYAWTSRALLDHYFPCGFVDFVELALSLFSD